MSEEPPKKKRKQTKNEKLELKQDQNTKRFEKRVESASNPTLFPQVFNPLNFAKILEKVLPTTSACQCPL